MPNVITVTGIGQVTIEELEAMLFAWVNSGAPKPVLEASREDKVAILRRIADRGDSQMRAVIDIYLSEI
jgi:hypothetical protein